MTKKFVYADIESNNAGREYSMSAREFFRLGQFAINEGPVQITRDYDEFVAVIRDADYVVFHNGLSFDLRVLFGVDSLEPLKMALAGKVIDTFVLGSLLTPAPYSYTNSKGHTFYGASKPEQAMKWLSLENQCFQFGLPGKFGDLAEIAKRYNPEKTPRKELDFGLIDLDDKEFNEYAEQDVIAVRGLYHYYVAQIEKQNYSSSYIWREMVIWAITAQITSNGVSVDIPEAQDRVAELALERDSIMEWLVGKFGFPTKGKQPWKSAAGKEAILAALADYGITPKHPDWVKTANGAPSFGGEVLKSITADTEAQKLGESLALLMGQRSLAQLALDSVKEDGKAHPDIMCLQRSGRTSVTRPGLTVWTARGPGAVEKRYFTADEGQVMVEADFSAADARAVAAVSGDAAFAKRFEPGVDSHDISGEIFFGHDAYHSDRENLRPVAKACIAEGELVLTDQGLVPIEEVTITHRVWDGQSFTTHGGIVYSGVQEVITYDGLTATRDHPVFTEEYNGVEIPFGLAAEIGARLVRSEFGGYGVRVGAHHFGGEEIRKIEKFILGEREMSKLLRGGLDGLPQYEDRKEPRVPGVRSELQTTLPKMAWGADGGRVPAMLQPEQSGVPLIRGSGGSLRMGLGAGCVSLGLDEPWTLRAGDDIGSNRHERELRAREPQTCEQSGPTRESEGHNPIGVPPGALAVCEQCSESLSEAGVFSGSDHRDCPGERQDEGITLQPRSRKTRVYDIRDSGPHHRFTVSGRLVHNCGHALAYRVGAGKLGETAGADYETGRRFIENYQKAYPLVARWQNKITQFGESNGYVENAWGRRMTVDEGRSFTQSSALIGQSTTREMLFDGLIRIAQDNVEAIRSVRMIVHDAIVFSVPNDRVQERVDWLMDRMQATFDPKTPVCLPTYFPMEYGPLDQFNWYSCSHG